MAMSRSIGASSLTILSPIRISPDVMVSSPATMRNVVVLPQPDGPTSTRNSLSRMLRFTSSTACTSSYALLSFRMTTWAIAVPFHAQNSAGRNSSLPVGSSLHRAGQTGDVMLDEERVYQRHRDGAEQGAGHQRPPEEHIAADELRGDPDRHRFLLRRRE